MKTHLAVFALVMLVMGTLATTATPKVFCRLAN